MIILDTNVVSEVMTSRTTSPALEWLQAQDARTLHLTAVTVAEITYGLDLLPAGRCRDELAGRWADWSVLLASRILPVGVTEAAIAGKVMAHRRSSGRPIAMPDALIAGVCTVRSAALATRNTRDFDDLGIDLVDPWSRQRT